MDTTVSSVNAAYQLDNIEITRAGQCIISIPQLVIGSSQCTALLGSNGSGKSTLLDVLAFVNRPCQGTISLHGQVISGGLSCDQRRMIGYVNQQPYLLNGTVADNIRLALHLQGINRQHQPTLINRTLALVGAEHLASQPASSLSGGELKRIAIARAISYQPNIVLLDEPFSHLDERHCRQLETIITTLKQSGITVVVTSHRTVQSLSFADTRLQLSYSGHTYTITQDR